MYGNYNNQAQSAPSVNTRLLTFYSDLSCLQIGLWNNNLSIKLNIAKGANADGIMQYDFDNRISTALVPERIIELNNFIENEIQPEIEKAHHGEPTISKSIAFDIGKGKNTRFALEYTPDENGIPTVYLSLYSNMGANGIPGNAARYKFNKSEYMVNYNPSTGSSDPHTQEAEFTQFADVIDKMSKITDETFARHGKKVYEMGSQRSNQNGGGAPQFNPQSQPNYNAPVTSTAGDDYPF